MYVESLKNSYDGAHYYKVVGKEPPTLPKYFVQIFRTTVTRCAVWYFLYNLKNVKKTHREVLLLVKLQVCELKPATLLNITPLNGCFSRFLIVQMVPNHATHLNYFPGHLEMALDISRSDDVKVNKTGASKGGLVLFTNKNFKINLEQLTPATYHQKKHYFKKDLS